MAYIVYKTNGLILATIKDGTMDTTTSLRLVGKNYIGYGEIMAENLLHLLENFAAGEAPAKAITGQIWFNSAAKQLNVYNGTEFIPLLKSTISDSQPVDPSRGDSWWNTTAKKFNVFDGTEWQQIGPLDTSPFARLAQSNQFAGNIVVDQTLTVGNLASLSTSAAEHVTLKNTGAGKNLLLGIKLTSGTEVTVLTINGANGQAEVATPVGSLAITNKGYVDSADTALSNAIVAVDTKANTISATLTSSVSNLSNLIAGLQQSKANIDSPALTGTPTVPTPALNAMTKQIVNAEFVQNNLSLKANLNSPVFTGTPKAPTAEVAENSNVLATTAFVKNHCGIEILNNAALSGSPTAPTQAGSDSTTKIATTAFVHSLLPRGVILMWSGTSAPTGWALCDGTNGTPDLRNRFIVGAGPGYALNSTGGATATTVSTQAAGSHNHGGSTQSHALSVDQLPSHNHVFPGDDQIEWANGIGGWTSRRVATFGYDAVSRGSWGGGVWLTSDTGGNNGHAHSINSDGNHTHAIPPITTVPPYYALAYIMKVF